MKAIEVGRIFLGGKGGNDIRDCHKDSPSLWWGVYQEIRMNSLILDAGHVILTGALERGDIEWNP